MIDETTLDMEDTTPDAPAGQDPYFYSPSTGGFYLRDIHKENIPSDAVEITSELHEVLLEGQSTGKVIAPPDTDHALPWLADAPPPTIDEVVVDYENRIQARLDNFARTLTYDGIMSACTYATSSVDMYRIEGQYCVDVRDATWLKAYMLMQEIYPTVRSSGAIPAWETIEAQLPELKWPEGSRGYVAG